MGNIVNQAVTDTKRSRIFIVDDHPLVREHLTGVLNCEPDLEVCGQAENRSEAGERICELKPDLAIVDLSLRDSHGLELIKDLRARNAKVRILVFSMHDESLYAERVIRAGAQGYITKQEATRKILFALRKILAGGIYLSDAIRDTILERLAANSEARSTQVGDLLTDREMQVFELTGRAYVTKQIAEQLGICAKTVETHRRRAKQKLKLRAYSDFLKAAIQYGHDHGLAIPPEHAPPPAASLGEKTSSAVTVPATDGSAGVAPMLS